MAPEVAGLTLALFTLAICVWEFILYPYVKKVTNCWVFWLVFASILLFWFIGVRWCFDLGWLIKVDHGIMPSEHSTPPECTVKSYLLSQVFCTDFCPFLFCALMISLILQPSRKFASYIAPILLFSCTVVIFGNVMSGDYDFASVDKQRVAAWSFQYLFIGIGFTKLKFFIHFFGIVMSLGVMINTPFHWKKFYMTFIVFFGFIIYACICSFTMNITEFVSGLRETDWLPNGNYYNAGNIFRVIFGDVTYPGMVPLVYFFCMIVILIWCEIMNLLQNKTKIWWLEDVRQEGSIFKGYYSLSNWTYKNRKLS